MATKPNGLGDCKETIKIIGYSNGTFELFINGERRRVTSIEFKVSLDELPQLTTTEIPV